MEAALISPVGVLYLTPRPLLHPAERGRKPANKSPLHRMETYAQHTRDYRGEVNNTENPRFAWIHFCGFRNKDDE
jgi:hypothetical protein